MHMQTHMLLSIGALIGDTCEQGHRKVHGPTTWSFLVTLRSIGNDFAQHR